MSTTRACIAIGLLIVAAALVIWAQRYVEDTLGAPPPCEVSNTCHFPFWR